MRKLFQTMKKNVEQGKSLVLVTVIDQAGSTPRGRGAHMLVDENGRIYGTIGGGAEENYAIEAAKQVLLVKRCRVEKLKLYPNEEMDLGMICGGEMTLHFQYLPGGNDMICEMAKKAEAYYANGKSCWLALPVSYEVHEEDAFALFSLYGEDFMLGRLLPQAIKEKQPSRPQLVELEGERFFLERIRQPGTVYIFGGGHVAQALVPILASVEFRCVIVEDRPEYCKPELFKGVADTCLIPITELDGKLHIEPADYICIMTREHQNDMICEAFALRTPARYIGVVGSRRKIATVNEKLKKLGFTDQDFQRVITPIGLPIQSETPAEIAISIAAQLILVRAQS